MDTIQNNNFFSSENQQQINSPNFFENNTNYPENNTNINLNLNRPEKKEIKNPFLEKPTIPNRTLPYFFLQDYLSDTILKLEQNEIPFHKIIISTASDFFFEYFKTLKNPYEKTEVNLPEYIKSSLSEEINNKEIIENIFKYCYHNQDINSIEESITKDNVFNYVEMSHCLQIKSLNENLEKIIIKNFLNEENIVKICEESLLFEMEEVHKQCKENILKNLGNIKDAKKELTMLKYDTFKDIISSDELDAESEKDICDLVIEYIKFRREIPEEIQEINNDINKDTEKINQEEKQENQEQKADNDEQIPENQENNEENNENIEEKKEEEQKEEINIENKENNNENDPYILWKNHLEELKKNSIKKRLTPEEERILVSCIRLSFLSHADLISLNNEPIMDNFKDLIMQGLSARLDTYENANEKNIIINLKPRKYLRQKKESIQVGINNENNNLISNEENNNTKRNRPRIEEPGKINKFNDPRNFAFNQNLKNKNFEQNLMGEDISSNNKKYMNYNNQLNKDENDFEEYNEQNNNININDINESNSNYLGAEVLNVEEINSMNKKLKNQNQNRPFQAQSQSPLPYPPQDQNFLKNNIQDKNKMPTTSSRLPIFKYNYDFDENGALYYLGTLGKKYIYRNPHELNLVKVFASSISKGEKSDFVGRNLVNLRTENEEFSFFGVDLGQNRRLVPSAYSLRNRNSSTHVLLCWELEGSNDKINFEVLDTRIFWSENYDINKKLERERNLLIEPGCTSTWGISKKVRERSPEGFRYFLIKQIDKNSNGSYNLTNSGFELYGEAKGSGWLFN